jgi:2OG-Fe(II) oxygenase superfamily
MIAMTNPMVASCQEKRMTKMITTLLCSALLLIVVSGASQSSKRGTNRHIKFMNDSGSKIEVYWVHPDTRETVLMSAPNVMVGADFPLDSYVGHEFEIREVPDGPNGECRHKKKQQQLESNTSADGEDDDLTCRHTYVTVSVNDEQVARITRSFTSEFIDNKIKADMQASDLIKECQKIAQDKLSTDTQNRTQIIMNEMLECVESGVASALELVNEEIAFQASVRKDIAATLENYTCVDDTLNSTADITTTTWMHPLSINNGDDSRSTTSKNYKIHIKHDRVASKIHLIEKFITPDECVAMEALAAKTLHDATVADGKGGSQLSNHRKAKQAGIKVPWDKPKDPISQLSRRVYDYVNHVLDLEIKENGQEDLMSIQYFGRGRNDTEPDRYTPHCDGDCTGQPHKYGNRMATMVMYCVTAESGGHTNFRNAGVHVKPVMYDAVFFSYIDPVTKTMDTGFTEHSGCPVFTGSKKIVTQWVRYGVSDEVPWDAFNTLGIKLSEAE